ncbi:MAG: hypothetical protein ACTSPX_05520 [Candidatus Thorarchaeota archaeon]
MNIDEGTYTVLKSALGAYSCRDLPLPRQWDPIRRPHVAVLIPDAGSVFHVLISEPKGTESGLFQLETVDLNSLPEGSIVEIRYDETDYGFYRKDPSGWTKVAGAQDPFFIEVYSSGYNPMLLNLFDAALRELMGHAES